MSAMLIRNARVLTMLAPGERAPAGPRRGAEHGTLGVLDRGDVLVSGGHVLEIVRGGDAMKFGQLPSMRDARELDAMGRVLMPGFVDCHTHACWAGSRIDEWERKLAGATYQEI